MSTTLTLPDISQWYTAERVAEEERVWAEGQHYKENARRIESVCDKYNLATVLEFGCGTGWIPRVLDPTLLYIAGLDANPHMIALARAKNPHHRFILHDIRYPIAMGGELCCAFAVLKHFSLADWPLVLSNILSRAHYGLFNMHALPDDREPFDAGTEWHSSWPRRCDIVAAISAAGHIVIDWDDSHLDSGVGAPEAYITTRRR